jgi:hypothetical protein
VAVREFQVKDGCGSRRRSELAADEEDDVVDGGFFEG